MAYTLYAPDPVPDYISYGAPKSAKSQLQNVNKPGHVTKGDIFDDLGLSPYEATEAKAKVKALGRINEYKCLLEKVAALELELQENFALPKILSLETHMKRQISYLNAVAEKKPSAGVYNAYPWNVSSTKINATIGATIGQYSDYTNASENKITKQILCDEMKKIAAELAKIANAQNSTSGADPDDIPF